MQAQMMKPLADRRKGTLDPAVAKELREDGYEVVWLGGSKRYEIRAGWAVRDGTCEYYRCADPLKDAPEDITSDHAWVRWPQLAYRFALSGAIDEARMLIERDRADKEAEAECTG